MVSTRDTVISKISMVYPALVEVWLEKPIMAGELLEITWSFEIKLGMEVDPENSSSVRKLPGHRKKMA